MEKNISIVALFIFICSMSLISCNSNTTKGEKADIEQIKSTENMGIHIGDKIPEIMGLNQDSIEVKASDFTGKKLVIYFYPKDDTPGCTTQACNLRDNYDLLLKAGYAVLGVSVDSISSHKKFIEKHNLPFPLIADTDHKLVEQFGVWGEKTLAGKKYMGISRTTFVVDEKGIVTEIISPKEVNTKDHAAQVLKTIN